MLARASARRVMVRGGAKKASRRSTTEALATGLDGLTYQWDGVPPEGWSGRAMRHCCRARIPGCGSRSFVRWRLGGAGGKLGLGLILFLAGGRWFRA